MAVIENPHKVKGKDVLDALQTTESGLSSGEAERRLLTYGANEIEERERKNYFRKYILQYTQFFAKQSGECTFPNPGISYNDD